MDWNLSPDIPSPVSLAQGSDPAVFMLAWFQDIQRFFHVVELTVVDTTVLILGPISPFTFISFPIWTAIRGWGESLGKRMNWTCMYLGAYILKLILKMYTTKCTLCHFFPMISSVEIFSVGHVWYTYKKCFNGA